MAINAKMNQLKSCSKYLQFVMDDNDVELKYDKATGISSNKYVYYAKALHNDNKDGYKKFTKWGKGEGNYYVARMVLSNSILWCLHIMTIQARRSM